MNNTQDRRMLLLVVAAALLAACSGRQDLWTQNLQIKGPYKMDRRAVWIDATRGLAVVLDPVRFTTRAVAIRRNASFIRTAPGGKQLLVLTRGKKSRRKDQLQQQPGLTLLGLDAAGAPRVVRIYPLSTAFDRLAVSSSGKHAVAYSSSSSTSGVFENPNEVALLDLTAAPVSGTNPRLRTLRSFGSAPRGVVFSPVMAVPSPSGAKRTLAVVLADNQLSLLDMDHPQRAEVVVPLSQLGGSAKITPREVLFSAATASIFIRASGAQDLYALQLMAKTPGSKLENDYLPVLNQPSSGKTAHDMALVHDAGQDLILTANASQDLSLIEAGSSQSEVIRLGEPVDTVMALPAAAPTMALVYSRASPRSRMHFIELNGLAASLDKNLVSRNLNQPVHQVVASADETHALVIHNAQRTVVSVLDLKSKQHTIAPIKGHVALESFDFARSPYLVGTTPTLKQLGLLDLSNLHPRNLELDHVPRKVLTLGDAIVVDHGSPAGLVTVVPHPRSVRQDCRVLWGFLFNGLLDQPLED